jgi:hypothetical protein
MHRRYRSKQSQRTHRYKAAVVFGGAAADVIDLVGETKILPVETSLSRSAFDRFTAHWHSPSLWRNTPMELFTRLFGSLLVFVYHCFDRIVINGYLNGLSRPEQVVHFVRGVRKENYVLPALRRMEKKNAYGVYFIFMSMEQGRTFRISMPKYPTQDPNYRILAHQMSRFTHYYF